MDIFSLFSFEAPWCMLHNWNPYKQKKCTCKKIKKCTRVLWAQALKHCPPPLEHKARDRGKAIIFHLAIRPGGPWFSGTHWSCSDDYKVGALLGPLMWWPISLTCRRAGAEIWIQSILYIDIVHTSHRLSIFISFLSTILAFFLFLWIHWINQIWGAMWHVYFIRKVHLSFKNRSSWTCDPKNVFICTVKA